MSLANYTRPDIIFVVNLSICPKSIQLESEYLSIPPKHNGSRSFL
jgi:hypothetical protein